MSLEFKGMFWAGNNLHSGLLCPDLDTQDRCGHKGRFRLGCNEK